MLNKNTCSLQFARRRFKLLVVGSKGCGKTALIRRLEKKDFCDTVAPNESRQKEVNFLFFYKILF